MHKLLFAGKRLLVAERSKEKVDRICSWIIVDARLADEKPVHQEITDISAELVHWSR